ncbi:hypothetical protein FUT87_07375 [Mitsuaria sp. TWR114]|uniref:hypothetical protein n=1 Tax=Mitsuaria sp. TWR114 TaxID=2601731 RepID=UPI0011BD6859|nr:hypothetical protein [Mitsuaria sp. TWR114]TXD94222.1 hypothetical protein FUT87_07375 [Mitsuaria sp. TWR114]
MFDVDVAQQILTSGALRVVRRMLFTGTKLPGEAQSAFDFESFYQHGSAIVLESQGRIYLLTPSHVIRNATGNQYTNDSPFWTTIRHEPPAELMDFLMPVRMHDMAPGGFAEFDAAIVEMNPMVLFGLPDVLNWDDHTLFCGPDEVVNGATAVVAGYPEQTNAYEHPEQEDGSIQQMATIRLTTFQGMISVGDDGQPVFVNFMHEDGYEYAGLSGGVVVCGVGGRVKYLGIVISSGLGGRRFKVVTFAKLRAALGVLHRLPWELLDEAYFLGHPTHSTMTFRDFVGALHERRRFVQRRSNDYLEQLLRTIATGSRPHWVCELEPMRDELKQRLCWHLVTALEAVASQRVG